eukprot:TRINITY_DN20303_c0_g1_i1.p1 TRINITY_DN20303_c0_g1~~TRINITY_DN20303_c0_g1_i1.p1  ORF type:complete len:209 (-),score=56.66 TRINITY_DN20303_c0_g1_i1:47-673(-)
MCIRDRANKELQAKVSKMEAELDRLNQRLLKGAPPSDLPKPRAKAASGSDKEGSSEELEKERAMRVQAEEGRLAALEQAELQQRTIEQLQGQIDRERERHAAEVSAQQQLGDLLREVASEGSPSEPPAGRVRQSSLCSAATMGSAATIETPSQDVRMLLARTKGVQQGAAPESSSLTALMADHSEQASPAVTTIAKKEDTTCAACTVM